MNFHKLLNTSSPCHANSPSLYPIIKFQTLWNIHFWTLRSSWPLIGLNIFININNLFLKICLLIIIFFTKWVLIQSFAKLTETQVMYLYRWHLEFCDYKYCYGRAKYLWVTHWVKSSYINKDYYLEYMFLVSKGQLV